MSMLSVLSIENCLTLTLFIFILILQNGLDIGLSTVASSKITNSNHSDHNNQQALSSSGKVTLL